MYAVTIVTVIYFAVAHALPLEGAAADGSLTTSSEAFGSLLAQHKLAVALNGVLLVVGCLRWASLKSEAVAAAKDTKEA